MISKFKVGEVVSCYRYWTGNADFYDVSKITRSHIKTAILEKIPLTITSKTKMDCKINKDTYLYYLKDANKNDYQLYEFELQKGVIKDWKAEF